MKLFIGCFIGLVMSASVGAESLLEGRVRLSSGQPAVGVQVRLFDLTDLRRSVGTTTDESGHFALPLRAFSADRGTALPTDFALGQNYPNPFNPSTVIPYQIPASAHVRLEVFNLLGQRLATLVDAEQSAGAHTAQWDGTDSAGRAVGAGVYIYRLSSGGMTESRRMVLVDGQAGIPAVALRPVQSAEEETAATDLPVYGLTVSGERLVAYVDPTFRVGVDEADIVLEEHGGSPRMKLAVGGLLGDVNNDDRVDISDVLYVLLYIMADSSMILPNNGDISLGDVNKDGTVDLADVLLLVRYTDDPFDPALPAGINATEVSLGSSISGSLSEGDVDYFLIEMSSAGLLVATTTGSRDTYGYIGYILDSSGNVLARNNDSGTASYFQVSASVSSGTYYIVVEGDYESATGDYTLDVQVLSIVTNLTQSVGDDKAPAWSPDGQRIVFESDRNGDYEVYIMSSDSSNLINLTQSVGDDKAPAWSPDGQRIAFVSNRDGNWEVYVMSSDGSNLTNLTQSAGDDRSPVWSPDGQRIAFVSNRNGDYKNEIYVMGSDGSNLINLTPSAYEDVVARAPVWSPDGQSIAFDIFLDVDYEVSVIDSDGNNFTNLTRSAGDDRSPVWSPDGQRIAFVSNRDGDYEIYVVDSDGSNPTNLTQNVSNVWSPAWSPNGQRIAFVSNGEIYVIDSDGSNLTRLTQNAGAEGSPAWSPNGQRIAFVSDRYGNREIYVIDVE